VEPRVARDRLSGRLIALQLKSGGSYLEKVEGGWVYRGKYKHLRCWLGHVLPVVIVFYDPDTGAMRWQRIAGTSFAVHYDEQHAVLVRDEVPVQEHHAPRQGIDDVENAARALAVEATPAPPDEYGASDPAWYAPVELAVARECALWCDDAAVRAAAAACGVSVFSSEALLAALIQAGLIPDTLDGDCRALSG
jgi:hypothetical protein